LEKTTPDIRMRSNGSAESRALMYITPEGQEFVRGIAARIEGVWREAECTYWMHDSVFPAEELRECGLKVVAGIGTTDEYDMPWP
jgi:hypothetical protein